MNASTKGNKENKEKKRANDCIVMYLFPPGLLKTWVVMVTWCPPNLSLHGCSPCKYFDTPVSNIDNPV